MTDQDSVTVIPASWNTYTVSVEPVSEWVPQVGDGVTIGNHGQAIPSTPEDGSDSPFTVVQTFEDNVVQIAPPDSLLDLGSITPNYFAESISWTTNPAKSAPPTPKPPAENEVDLTHKELDLIAYALDNLDEDVVATTFGLSVEEADEFLNQLYKKIKD